MLKYLTLFFLFLIQVISFAGTPIVFKDAGKIMNIRDSYIESFEDKENKYSIKDIQSSGLFQLNRQHVPNFGISKSTFWIKLEIKNEADETNLLLNLAYPNLDEVELYAVSENMKYSITKMGKNKPFSQRNYQTPGYIFDLTLPKGKTLVCYLKIKSGGQILAPMTIGVAKKTLESVKQENFYVGIYCGIILIMFFYNLFIYYAVRDKVYLYYVGYIFIVGLVQLCLLGYTFQFFWPNSCGLALHSLYILSALVGITSIEFIKIFLQTKTHTPTLHKGFFVLSFIYIAYIILDFFNLGAELYGIIQLCAMLLSFYMIVVAFKIAKKGSSSAKFFLLAWTVFLVGVFIYALKDVGVLPYNSFTIYSMPFGSAIETVLLSFALADRINILKKEKEESQATALDALKENEKLITEQNVVLERKVEERTVELQSTLTHLKDTQTQLVNAEKMASLGQLTAGIAHEINNPINFVSANVKPLKLDIGDILELLKKYEVIALQEISPDKLSEIEKFKKEIDVDYLKQEMTDLLSGIEDGAKRTADIVSGLKNFSRLDESDVKEANINEGIESTLILLKSAVPENTEVIRNLGNIPMIECLPGKLNQVFMNLFSNAFYAINRKEKRGDNKLTISTYTSGEKVFVSIEDTGIGMTKEVKDKMFDPFFTTKDVGEGTGLGMSIVFKIIESHGASIEVESEHGVGTKILLILNKKITL